MDDYVEVKYFDKVSIWHSLLLLFIFLSILLLSIESNSVV